MRKRISTAVLRIEVFLQGKQSARFRADISHMYHNVSDQPCAAYNMIFYSND